MRCKRDRERKRTRAKQMRLVEKGARGRWRKCASNSPSFDARRRPVEGWKKGKGRVRESAANN